jgi:hypothetical protein
MACVNSPIHRVVALLLLFQLNACGIKSIEEKIPETGIDKNDTTAAHSKLESNENINSETDLASYYIVISDTGTDYQSLSNKLFEINRKSGIPIDSMGRTYNKKKNLIALPDNDEDELYAGNYFPRRFPSDYLSLEYLRFYKPHSAEKTIALVTGIYEQEKAAESALLALKKMEKKAFKIKAELYTGCIH